MSSLPTSQLIFNLIKKTKKLIVNDIKHQNVHMVHTYPSSIFSKVACAPSIENHTPSSMNNNILWLSIVILPRTQTHFALNDRNFFSLPLSLIGPSVYSAIPYQPIMLVPCVGPNYFSANLSFYISVNSFNKEKWFQLQGERAHSLHCFVGMFRGCSFQKQNRKEEEEEETEQQQQQTYQFTQGSNNLHRLQVHHPSYTINIYQLYIYIHT